MSAIRKYTVGIRFSEEERLLIEKGAKEAQVTYSDFVRRATLRALGIDEPAPPVRRQPLLISDPEGF